MSFSNAVRFYHHSATAEYMRLWKPMGVDYAKSIDSTFKQWHRVNAMYQSPRTVQDVAGTEVAMKKRGYVPFVHALPAAAKVLMQFYQADRPSQQEQHFKYLRSPLDKAYQVGRAEVPQAKDGAQSSYHLSMGYALSSGVKPLESPASWGFVNHFGPEQRNRMNDMFADFLKDTGMSLESAAYIYFQKRGMGLIRKYSRLNVGEFLVIGISPDKVDRYVYDAKPFNIPTGKKASDVAADPKRHLEALRDRGTHMASMVMCDETVQPNSDIVMVLASESGSFRAGIEMKPMKDVEEFDEVVSPFDTEFEAQERQTRKELDAELESLSEEFREYQKSPKSSFPRLEEEPFDPRDSVELLP